MTVLMGAVVFWDLLNRLGRIHLRMKQVDRASALFQHAREQARGVGSLVGEARIVTNLAAVFGQKGQLPEARKHFEEALTLSERAGDRLGMARVEINLSRLVGSMGDARAARDLADRGLKHAQAVAWREGIALATQALRSMRA